MEFDSLTYNLLSLWEKVNNSELTDGSAWYARAKYTLDCMAETHQIEPGRVYTLCAVLSPQTHWDKNLLLVAEYLQFGFVRDIPKARQELARLAYAGYPMHAITKGRKTLSFENSIRLAGTGSDPCIDTHAINAAIGEVQGEKVKKAIWASRRLYESFQESYREAAERCNLTPQKFQAVIWAAWRSRLQFQDLNQPTLLEVE